MSEFVTAGKIICGRDCLERLGPEAARLGTRALIVTGRHSMQAAGTLGRAQQLLRAAGLEVEIFARVEPEPSFATVDEGAEVARARGVDVMVGLGGGSAIDAAKIIAYLATQRDSVGVYYSGKEVASKGLPFVAIPTTAGSGAEVTRNSVLTDRETQKKGSVRSDYLIADVVIADPVLTVSLPPDITAYTGMDALTQAIESYVSRGATLLTDALAGKAIHAISANLEAAYDDGGNLEAREAVMVGSLLAGMALTNARLGAVHGLAHALGVWYTIPHGLVCAVLLPSVMEFNLSENYELAEETTARYSTVAHLMGADTPQGLSPAEAAGKAVGRVRELLDRFGIGKGLREFGVARDDFAQIAAESMPSGSLKANPRPATEDDLIDILRRVF